MYVVTNNFTGRKTRHNTRSGAARQIIKLGAKLGVFSHYITCKDALGNRYIVDFEAAQPKSITGHAPRFQLIEIE